MGDSKKGVKARTNKVRIATIGNSMVGHRFIEELLDKAPAGQSDITVFYEEPRIACDRVHLSSYFFHHTAEELSLVREGFYERHGVKVLVGERAVTTSRQEKAIHSSARRTTFYGKLIMMIDSYPWIPPIKGVETRDCFVCRTIEDLNAIESYVRHSKRDAVVGGGLLDLGAADVLKNLGVETHMIEFTPMLMTEQFDQMNGEQLWCKIESMGVRVHTSGNTREVVQQGTEARKAMHFADGNELRVGFIVFSTGIRPRDKLTIQCGLTIAQRGGIVVNDSCQTSDSDTYVIEEYVSWSNRMYNLAAPGYRMAQVAVNHLLGSENSFTGTGPSARLELLDMDVDEIGDAHGRTPGARSYVYLDGSEKVYKRLIISADNKTLPGTVLVGDTDDYGNLLQLVFNVIELPENPNSLIPPTHAGSGRPSIGVDKLSDNARICSCSGVSKGGLIAAINKGCHTIVALKVETKAGTGCGGHILLVTQVLNAKLVRQGIGINNNPCEHFAYFRRELFYLIHVKGIKTFDRLLEKHGQGYGCEIRRPIVGSSLASYWNEYILKPQRASLQDINDNFFTNIQKDGACLVIPRPAGGGITPEGLVAVGRITCEFNLYTKITGPQCIDLFDAQKDDLSKIWRQLIKVGFEISHVYAKALRMAKTCVGSTWCHYGVGDSVGFNVKLENRYKDTHTPHKMKFDVSDCTRECVGAQSKDVGIIATEKGWGLYVYGDDGMRSRHADLLAADLDRKTLIRHPDHFTMFYTRATDKLTHAAPWLDSMEGSVNYPHNVIIDGKLGLNDHLEEKLARLRAVFAYEWTETVNDPAAQTRFKHFINSDQHDPNVQVVPKRDQHRLTTLYERIPVALVEENI